MAETKAPKQIYLGTGRRKTAVARVRLVEGSGKIEINGRKLEDFFTEDKDRAAVTGPLQLVDMAKRLDIRVLVEGGGITGQAGAISQGLARALKTMFSPAAAEAEAKATATGQPAEPTGPIGMVKKLRDSGYLTRDGRMKERKKYGRKGARRSFQFSKR
jgi:small subunit ribosomal protein S9